MSMYARALILFAALVFAPVLSASGQPDSTAFESALRVDAATAATPWTHLNFANDPDEFQFAIVSDRTGGHRDGVFGRAIDRLNRLRPEFVMSVGDLIEGYTEDSLAVARQWAAFDSLAQPLDMPFFALPGNHDISNAMMRRQWMHRYGAASYTFTYKGVLFIVMDSNDGDGVVISDRQVSQVKDALAAHADVRWTFVFMHHPLWRYEESGFDEVESALAGRPHTVLAGHTHRYEHDTRSGNAYMILSTTGGGSRLRGPAFGEFDHVTWVTVTKDQGPVFLNLALDGMVRHDASTPETIALAQQLQQSADLDPQVLVAPDGRTARVQLRLANPTDRPLTFQARFFHHHQADPSLRSIDRTIGPGQERTVRFAARTTGATIPLDAPAGGGSRAPADTSPSPLELEWTMSVRTDGPRDMRLHGTYRIPLVAASGAHIAPARDTFLDTLTVRLSTPHPRTVLRYTTDGSTPTAASQSYDAPFTVAATTTVRMRAFGEDGFRSDVVNKTFERVDPRPSDSVAKARPGLAYAYFEGTWKQLPDFAALQPVTTGVAHDFDVDALAAREDHYGVRYTGFVDVPITGLYTFHTRSDDGTKLYIGEELVVDNDGSHSAQTASGYIALEAGQHPIRIDYFEDFLGETLEVYYAPIGEERRAVTFEQLTHIPN